MNTDARKALSTIRRCIASERFRLTEHFTKRLDDRGMFWADVLAAIDTPARVVADRYDDAGELTVFITAFGEDKR